MIGVERILDLIGQMGPQSDREPRSIPAPPPVDLKSVAPAMEDLMRRLLAAREAELPEPPKRQARKPRKKTGG